MREVGLAVFAFVFVASGPTEALEWSTVTIDCKLTPASVLTLDKGKLTPNRLDNPDFMLLTFTGFDKKSNSPHHGCKSVQRPAGSPFSSYVSG